jgi:hypothetical protein
MNNGRNHNFRIFGNFDPWKRGLKTPFSSANGGYVRKFESFVGNLGGFAPHRKKWISATVGVRPPLHFLGRIDALDVHQQSYLFGAKTAHNF